jgi:transposase
VEIERTFVGLDVHARSVVACALDDRTGELSKARLVPDNETILAWLHALPGPVAVVYEAGPTGFGLARFLTGHGVRCVVAAPSKMHRPSGDRVKTDAKDALLLARLLRLGELTAVTIPSLAQEAARDLVRVREDVRADLMRARHRTSKLLLRQGILWSGGTAWTGAHEQWLGQQRFELPGLQAAYDTTLETVLLATSRRARLDKAIVEMAHEAQWWPVVSRLQCLRGVSTLTAFGLAVEVGDWSRFSGSTIGAYLGLVPTESSAARVATRARSPRPGTPTPGGCWSRRPGTTAGPTGRPRPCAIAGTWPLRPQGPEATPATSDCTSGGCASPNARSGPSSPTSPSPASSPAGAGLSLYSKSPRLRQVADRRRPLTRQIPGHTRESAPERPAGATLAAARGVTRELAMSSP